MAFTNNNDENTEREADHAATLLKIEDFLNDSFDPADSMEDATHFFSTSELRTQIGKHIGYPITGEEVYDALKSCKYKCEHITPLHPKWLFKTKQPICPPHQDS